jgi:diadenylate cyclase
MNILLTAAASSEPTTIQGFLSFVKAAFLDFGVNDAIDIILLTVLFALSFRFLKNRKAGALIFGIVVLLAVYAVASLFELPGIRFILSGLFQIGAILLVIIFQPELRELLEKVGSRSLKSLSSLGEKNSKKQLYYRTIDSICKAVQLLSVEKTGALIVIERTTQLDDILHTGITLNAEVSDALLRNIFYNRAPLHDGAVIIDDGKIAAASCILPLPRRTAVEADLGTRHRAAVGMSEVSDAVIIVVSEETGIISVAKECELIRNFSSDTLRKYLRRELLRGERREEENI